MKKLPQLMLRQLFYFGKFYFSSSLYQPEYLI